MDSQAVAVGIQHAHAAGKSRGFGQGAVILGTVGILAVIGAIAFLNQKADADKKDAIYQAENRSFSSGVDIGKKEALDAQRQVSRVVSV
jgi:hypothetical protein